jgi:hypothetical protein
MLARNVERFHAILGLQDVVTMRVQQIMKELHIELVVLHDQNRLGFGIHHLTLQSANPLNRGPANGPCLGQVRVTQY